MDRVSSVVFASVLAVAGLFGPAPRAGAQDSAPAIEVEKRDLPSGNGTRPGDLLHYVIEIRNVGGGPAFDVRLKDDASPGTALVAGSVVAPLGDVVSGDMDGDLSVLVDFSTVGPGAVRTVEFDVRVDDGGSVCMESVENQASVDGSNFESVVSDDPDSDEDLDPTRTPLITPFDDCLADLMLCQENTEIVEGERNACFEDLDLCQGELGVCSAGLASCRADSEDCLFELGSCREAAQSLQQRIASLESFIRVLQERLARCDEPLPDEVDSDGDGVGDVVDRCLGTAGGAPVDPDGCSREQFCAAIDVSRAAAPCNLADRMNDEPVSAKDCRVRRGECRAR